MEKVLKMLPLPPVQRIPLARTPLVLAICQIQYSAVLSVADVQYVAAFQRAIQDTYPVANQSLQVQIGMTEVRPTPSIQYQFEDLASIWKVVLTPTSLSLETRSYTDFSEFTDRLRKVFGALTEHIRPPVGTRIGLRYINELRPGHTEWHDVVSSPMLGPLAVPAFVSGVEQIASLQQLTLRYVGNQGVNVHHGVIPGGTTVQHRPGEQVPDGPFYLLDFDVYQEFPAPGSLLMDVDQIVGHVENYHQVIYRLFRWSITDQYLASLRRI